MTTHTHKHTHTQTQTHIVLTIMVPPWRLDAMAFIINDPWIRGSENGPLVSVNSELNAADTWLRIWAAEVL